MSLCSSLKYLESDDRIIGFKDTVSFSSLSSNVTKQVLQFMVHGISTEWKQPIGHFFVGNSVSAAIIQKMLEALVSKLERIGVTVVAIACDQEASHRLSLTALDLTIDNLSYLRVGKLFMHA